MKRQTVAYWEIIFVMLYLTKDLYPECINSQNSITRKQPIMKKFSKILKNISQRRNMGNKYMKSVGKNVKQLKLSYAAVVNVKSLRPL